MHRDITPHDNISNEKKYEMELAGMNVFMEQLQFSSFALEVKNLWLEYEAGQSKEALLCKDIDKFEMILQAFEYEKGIWFLKKAILNFERWTWTFGFFF